MGAGEIVTESEKEKERERERERDEKKVRVGISRREEKDGAIRNVPKVRHDARGC